MIQYRTIIHSGSSDALERDEEERKHPQLYITGNKGYASSTEMLYLHYGVDPHPVWLRPFNNKYVFGANGTKGLTKYQLCRCLGMNILEAGVYSWFGDRLFYVAIHEFLQIKEHLK